MHIQGIQCIIGNACVMRAWSYPDPRQAPSWPFLCPRRQADKRPNPGALASLSSLFEHHEDEPAQQFVGCGCIFSGEGALPAFIAGDKPGSSATSEVIVTIRRSKWDGPRGSPRGTRQEACTQARSLLAARSFPLNQLMRTARCDSSTPHKRGTREVPHSACHIFARPLVPSKYSETSRQHQSRSCIVFWIAVWSCLLRLGCLLSAHCGHSLTATAHPQDS